MCEAAVKRIEVDFATTVLMSADHQKRLCDLIQEIAKANEPKGYVHWQSGHGSKPDWSSEPVEFDDTVYHIQTSCRPK